MEVGECPEREKERKRNVCEGELRGYILGETQRRG